MNNEMVTLQNAPRDINSLTQLPPAMRLRLAFTCKIFESQSPEEAAFIALSSSNPQEQARILLEGLQNWDRTEGTAPQQDAAAPPPQPVTSPPPMQQQTHAAAPPPMQQPGGLPPMQNAPPTAPAAMTAPAAPAAQQAPPHMQQTQAAGPPPMQQNWNQGPAPAAPPPIQQQAAPPPIQQQQQQTAAPPPIPRNPSTVSDGHTAECTERHQQSHPIASGDASPPRLHLQDWAQGVNPTTGAAETLLSVVKMNQEATRAVAEQVQAIANMHTPLAEEVANISNVVRSMILMQRSTAVLVFMIAEGVLQLPKAQLAMLVAQETKESLDKLLESSTAGK